MRISKMNERGSETIDHYNIILPIIFMNLRHEGGQ